MKNLLSLMLVAVFAAVSIGHAQSGRTTLEATLYGNAKGKAKWQVKDTSSQMQAELSVEVERLAPNANFTIGIGNNPVWSVTSNAFGRLSLRARYSGPNRPTIHVGDQVVVLNATGMPILTGVFQLR